ncbi:MAG: YheU family protein [Proteobacteria bacterium]|nr:YheU family protein [Pseudomonadota bacterium]
MAHFVEVPLARLDRPVLEALLEEFASRDGTDYGAQEYTLEQKTTQLRRQLESSDLLILYDTDNEEWDLVEHEQAACMLAG